MGISEKSLVIEAGIPEMFHGKSKQDPCDWLFALHCFFEVAQDLRDPTSSTLGIIWKDSTSPAESLDRHLLGLMKHVKAQVLLQKPTNTEDAMRLAEIYDPFSVWLLWEETL